MLCLMSSNVPQGIGFAPRPGPAHVIVLGNEKGGSGKSTTAMHVAVHLLRQGYRVGCLDLDARQGTLRRYIKNRLDFAKAKGLQIASPTYAVIERVELESRSDSIKREEAMLDAFIGEFQASHDFLIVDTPGSDSSLARRALGHADTLLTPMNDSFVDLDILGQIDSETYKVARLSHYSEVVWEQRKTRAARGGRAIDWVVMRNRLGTLDSYNNRAMETALGELSARIGFRLIHGLTERVIFRELFLKGLTLLDLRDVGDEVKLSMSHIAARQEVAQLVAALNLEDGAATNPSLGTGRNAP
jgi:chromosome partitioning protein